MCWIGKNVPLIAKDDINVYKLVYVDRLGVAKSVYHPMLTWKLGKVCTTSLGAVPIGHHEANVYKGFHCYSVKDVFLELKDCNRLVAVRHVLKNLDTIVIHDWSNLHSLAVMECTIPKGAVYYKNEYGEMVTDRIRPDKIIKITKDEPKHLIFKMK